MTRANIHDIITEQTELAKTYAEDGAFLSAARVLRDLAETITRHDKRLRATATPVRETALATLLMVGVFATLMFIGFPLRFDGAMPWELLP